MEAVVFRFWISAFFMSLLLYDPAFAVCTGGTELLTATEFSVISFTYPTGSANYGQNLDLCWKVSGSSSIVAKVTGTVGPLDHLRTYDAASATGSTVIDIEDNTGFSTTNLYSSNTLFITFITDNLLDAAKDIGFKIEFIAGSSTACNTDQTATTTTSYFSSVNFPNKYAANLDCTYTITAGTGNTITASVLFHEIENVAGCTRDYLQITDPASGTSYSKLCTTVWGTDQTVTSTGNTLTVKFVSDQFDHKFGWVISYKEIEGGDASPDTNSCGDGCIAGAVVGSVAGASVAAGAALAVAKGWIKIPGKGKVSPGKYKGDVETQTGKEANGKAHSGKEANGKAPSGAEANGEAPSGTDAHGEAPSSTEATGEAPSGMEANGEVPSGTEAIGEAPSGMETNGEVPYGTEANGVAPLVLS